MEIRNLEISTQEHASVVSNLRKATKISLIYK
jgi:hypothetical protein